jgi:hypothetical protein
MDNDTANIQLAEFHFNLISYPSFCIFAICWNFSRQSLACALEAIIGAAGFVSFTL